MREREREREKLAILTQGKSLSMPTVAANAVLPLSNKANFILWLVFVRLGNLVSISKKN